MCEEWAPRAGALAQFRRGDAVLSSTASLGAAVGGPTSSRQAEKGCQTLRVIVAMAALDLALVAVATLLTTSRSEILGVAAPTLLTQGLLVIGMGLNSSTARLSYVFWTLLGYAMSWAGGDIYSDGSAFARWSAAGSNLLTFGALVGLCLPSVGSHLKAVAYGRRCQSAAARTGRARRNLALALCWAAVLPVSLVVGALVETPPLAVLVASAPALVVSCCVAVRQASKLRRRAPAVSSSNS